MYNKTSTIVSKELLYKILEHSRYDTERVQLTKTLERICSIDESKYDNKFLQYSIMEFTKRKSNC